jgi:hydroxyethylthiazole kinase-like uncharacterized protein yjeF
MRSAHTVEQVRAAEAELMARLPEGTLMARAATALGHAVIDLLGGAYGRRVVVLVGSGDNGGDALYAGAMLARRGASVEARLLSDRAHQGGVAALRAAGGLVVMPGTRPGASWLSRGGGPEVVVDGIVGIGGKPGLRPEAAAALAACAGVPVVAVDVPSGVEVDTGRLDGPHVRADLTVTFGTHKVAHLVDPAAAACGAVELVDIGLDLPEAAVTALQPDDVSRLLRRPVGADHKYTRGVVGVRTGAAYPGAGVLSSGGAACGLAGMVRYVGPQGVGDQVRAAHPEVVTTEGRVQAWVVGSGGGEGAPSELAAALADGVPVVVDADGLIDLPELTAPAVLTPHAGELAAMLGVERAEVEDRQLDHARLAAEKHGAVVMLKGRRSLVAHPDGRVRVTTTGVPWLATAGAGDVLAGMTGALLATGLDPFDAASAASWLHGAAATLASRGGPIVAGDVARCVPEAVRGLPH